MTKTAEGNKKLLKELQAKLKMLQAELALVHKREGNDPHIDVKIKKNQARFERVRKKGVTDTALGRFYLQIDITAKQETVFVPISVASGKKTAGFMYQIEGTGESSLSSADIKVRGDGVSQVTLGTLVYAKIPAGKTALFQIQATTRGEFGKVYKIVFTRLNYKLQLTELRYQQYVKEIHSEPVTFS